MNELETFLRDVRQAVDETLNSIVPRSKDRLNEAIRWSLFGGGKCFRPGLLIAVGETFNAEREKLMHAAAAVEMIHTYSLIHDDLPSMDDDDLRRGRETCHKKFSEATAILAGDALQALAFQAIADDANLPVEIRLRLISLFAHAATQMVAGQQMDLKAEGKQPSIGEIELIHQSKTGELITACAKAGAMIGEANENDLSAVHGFASKLGLLFQITDDLLDLTQTTEILGKTVGKDKVSEKATYPGFYGIEETRILAEKAYLESCKCLDKIDRQTDLLREIAGFILNRRS